VHGLGGQLVDWPQEFVDRLVGRGFRVVRFDNRDIGLSTEFTSPPPDIKAVAKAILLRRSLRAEYTLSDMASDAVGLLDELDIRAAHVVGVSMGGMISQQMAIDHPDRVLSLTSIMSTTGSRKVGQPSARVIRKTVRRPRPTPETAVDLAAENFRLISGPHFDEAEFRRTSSASVARSFRPEGTARQMAAIVASGDRTAELRRVDVPTLVVHGMLDRLVRPSGGMATARAVPGSRLLMFNDMGHDLPRPRWNETIDAIAANVARAGETQAGPTDPTPALADSTV
jgi:pimeloyl-ACP methyl ester carboxylesterase